MRSVWSVPFFMVAVLGCGDGSGGLPDARVDAPVCVPERDCDDGLACTRDSCAADGTCRNEPDDAACGDDGVACTTARCDATLGCVHEGSDAACDDGVACTVDACGAEGCTHAPQDAMCDDGVDCTDDRCGGSSGCLNVPDDTACGGGQVCRADTGCFSPPPCDGPGDPRCDDGQDCTVDSCDPASGRCTYEADHAACDDGAFCSGVERCAPFRGCLLASVPSCDDGIPCTIDQCDEVGDACEFIPEHRLCGDGVFCNGGERCDPDAGGCTPGAAVACDDANSCTVDTCDESLDRCGHTVVDADGDGDGDLACGGGDCDDGDPAVSSLSAEACNGADDDCDGRLDEGVLGPCGDCDPSCRRRETRMGDFARGSRVGTEYDPVRGGLVIRSETREANFLWVPNTAESTLSKWDATTATEIGRYRVGLPGGECPDTCCWAAGCNMPSRVVVDGRGDVYVANRGFGMQGTVTKIAANVDDCVDRNLNGMIDTSSDATPMGYDTDECVLWTAPVGPVDSLLRAIAIDRGDAAAPEGYPWVGGYNAQRFWKLDPSTGAIIDEVGVAPLHPYGAIVLGDGRLWVSTLSDGMTGYFETVGAPGFSTLAYPTAMRGGCVNSYGMTADAAGRLWWSGWSCNDAFGLDTRSGQWTRVNTTGYGLVTGRGITVDARNRIWMALGGDGQSELVRWDADGFVPGGTIGGVALRRITLPAGHTGPSGVGADKDGNIWVAHHVTSQLVRVDPDTSAMTSYTGPNRVYTYSDFTGSVRRTVIGVGSFTEDFDAGCDAPRWGLLDYDVGTPAGSSVSFAARTADSAAGLPMMAPVPVETSPPETSPADVGTALDGAAPAHGRFLRLTTTLDGSGGASPVLRSYSLTWACP